MDAIHPEFYSDLDELLEPSGAVVDHEADTAVDLDAPHTSANGRRYRAEDLDAAQRRLRIRRYAK